MSGEEKKGMMDRMKEKWGLESNLQVVFILIVFSLAGSSIVLVRKPAFVLMGIDEDTVGYIKVIAWLIIVFPTYQCFLLFYGFIFGQFSFFWEKEKKMARGISKLFGAKRQ